MRRKCLYALLGVALIWASCSEQVLDMPDLRVALDAEVQEMVQQESRAVSGVDIYTGTSGAGMKAAVWFSDTDGVYPESSPASPTFLPYRANLTYDEGATIVYTQPETSEDPVSYVVEGEDRVYCVGLYPQSGWTANDEKTVATHVVDGKQDLMFAVQQSGSMSDKIGKQTYRHLLPWVKFTVRATDPEAASDWGKVKNIQLVNAKGSVSITLGTGEVTYSSSSEDVEVLDAPLDLTVAIQDIGSALCMPSDGYGLNIVTDKGEVKTLSLNLDFEAGKLYLVNLYFNPHNDINAVCSLVPWNEENVEL